jgi:AAA ATPase domain
LAEADDHRAHGGRNHSGTTLRPELHHNYRLDRPLGDVVASCALRILSANRLAIESSDLKTQLATWLDEHYARPLSAFYARAKARNAFEILNAFAPVIPALEDKLGTTIAALKTLDGVEVLRQRLMQLLNGAAGKVLIRPFLPPEAMGDLLSEIFSAALEVRAADDGQTVGTQFRRMGAHIDELALIVDHAPTLYGRTVLLSTIERLQEAAKRKLELKSPPAALTFAVSERPLPLLEAGVTCSVAITVTNDGDAPANEVELTFATEDSAVIVVDETARLGRMEPRTRQRTAVSLTVNEPVVELMLDMTARWTNADHTVGQADGTATLRAHEVHIDWPTLEGQTPFAPYPVETPEALVGRQRQLRELRSAFDSAPMANLYVTGQRRVGKTSLVRVFIRELRGTPKLCTATVELGEARGGAGAATIATLGRKLAERIVAAAGLRGEVAIPSFDDSLAPLTDVVDAILEWDADLRFLFVIDEFDELPHETYRRDGPGDALFVPLRSLAQKPHVGWLLVGGERMPYIRDEQAARLNNFREMSLDYLPLHEEGGTDTGRDFADLVRRPLPPGFQIDEAAVRALYDQSAGNPHFAKEISTSMFSQAVARRDALLSSDEVSDAVSIAARERDVELFAHFWEDGIFEIDDQRRQVELDRREYLAGIASLLRSGASLTEERLRQAALTQGLEDRTIARLGTEFVRRGILEDNGHIKAVHVPLFRYWLESEGIYKLPPKGISERIGQQLAQQRETLQVGGGEVRRLVRQWERFTYQGQHLSRDQIDSWLEQFDTVLERRFAFRFLERLHLFSDGQIFEGMRRLQRQVAQEGRVQLRRGQRSLSHLFVSPLGQSGSSGEAFAYTYRQANNISSNSVVPALRLVDRLLARTDVTTVVLIDDFIGSGGTAIKALKPLAARIGELGARSEVQWFLFAVSGLQSGAEAIARSSEARKLGLRVELALPLLEVDLPFGDRGTVYEADERPLAEATFRKYGKDLSLWPLGFGEQCAPVVFPDNCPNNAPPVLWSDANGWRPLFRRTGR